MLKSIDVLIGLSVVMLIVSMAVTLVNQAILSAMAARGDCLQKGLADMLQHLDWRMPRQTAEDIAAMVLTQPSVRKKKVTPVLSALFPALQFGEVIHREEFVKILLSFGPREAEIKEALSDVKSAIEGNAQGATQQEVQCGVSDLICAVRNIGGVRDEVLQEIEKTLEEIGGTESQGKQKQALEKVVGLLSAILDPLQKIVDALSKNGVSEPGKTLDNVRMMALQLEKTNPEQANDVRQTNALLQEASSPFLAKINLSFDQVMDRVTSRYTAKARVVTLFSAALVAIVLQLDTVYIFNRLSTDDKAVKALVDRANELYGDEQTKKIIERDSSDNRGASTSAVPAAVTPAAAAQPDLGAAGVAMAAPAPAPPQAPRDGTAAATATSDPPAKKADKTGGKTEAKTDAKTKDNLTNDQRKTKYYVESLADQGIIRLASGPMDWRERWNTVNPAGLLLSILLLSLGAPFWYKALGKLLQLRSLLAQKDDDQRVTRQTTQSPETSSKPGAPPSSSSASLGERGNLGAAG